MDDNHILLAGYAALFVATSVHGKDDIVGASIKMYVAGSCMLKKNAITASLSMRENQDDPLPRSNPGKAR